MDAVETLVASEPASRASGASPSTATHGEVYSDEVVERLPGCRPRLRISASCGQRLCRSHLGQARRAWRTSFAPAGRPAPGAGPRLRLHVQNLLCRQRPVFMAGSAATWSGPGPSRFQTIGPDKLNQRRHVVFFKDMAGIETTCRNTPPSSSRSSTPCRSARTGVGRQGIAEWTRPVAGTSRPSTPGRVRAAVVKMAADAESSSPRGSTYRTKRTRATAIFVSRRPSFRGGYSHRMEVLAVCVEIASLEKTE